MVNFNEQEYRNDWRILLDSRGLIKNVADDISRQGLKNLFFVGAGGSLSVMMGVGDIGRQLTKIPIYIAQAAEIVSEGHKQLSRDSVAVLISESGDTKEIVAAAKWFQMQQIRVVDIICKKDSPLERYCTWYIPNLTSRNRVEFEYTQFLLLFLELLHQNGEFRDYELFADQMKHLPDDLVRAKEKFEPQASEIAAKYFSEPYIMFVGGGVLWGVVYLFAMCILEEMQWICTQPVSSSEFFHGCLELVDDDMCVFLIKGEDKTRVVDERAERFLRAHTNKLVVVDTKSYDLEGIDDRFRWFLSPLIANSILTERLAVHFEANTKHDLSYRRYYRRFDY